MGYIADHWAGRQSLAQSYWVNGVLAGLAQTALLRRVQDDTDLFDEPWLYGGAVAFSIALGIWSLVGIWRAARRSKATARRAEPRRLGLWAWAAQFMVVVGVLRVFEWVPAIDDYVTQRHILESDVATQFYIDYAGNNEVILHGYIHDRSVAALTKAFEDKRRDVLTLDSPGGILDPAYRLADLVEARGIAVYAQTQCISSCLLVLAAAPDRATEPNTLLAFHHPEPLAAWKSRDSARELADEIDEYYARFERYGVPRATLEEYRLRKFVVLSLDEARNAGFVNSVWLPETATLLSAAAFCRDADCSKPPSVYVDETPAEERREAGNGGIAAAPVAVRDGNLATVRK